MLTPLPPYIAANTPKKVTFSSLEAALGCAPRRIIAHSHPHGVRRGFWCDNAAINPLNRPSPDRIFKPLRATQRADVHRGRGRRVRRVRHDRVRSARPLRSARGLGRLGRGLVSTACRSMYTPLSLYPPRREQEHLPPVFLSPPCREHEHVAPLFVPPLPGAEACTPCTPSYICTPLPGAGAP